jgi:hypothetical protein
VGSGLSTAIELHGYVQGVAREVVNSPDGTFTQAYVNTAQPFHTHKGGASGKDPFELKLSFDPSPGQASAPASGNLPQLIRDALNKPNGELALAAGGGRMIGAETVYGPKGRVSLCYTRKLVAQDGSGQAPGGSMTIEVSYCGWLTQGADTWAPQGLPPTDRGAAAGP